MPMKTYKLLFLELVFLLVSIVLSPVISKIICKSKIETNLKGVVRSKNNSEEILTNITVIYEGVKTAKTNSEGIFIMNNISTQKSRFSFLGCSECNEITEIPLKFFNSKNSQSTEGNFPLENTHISDTIEYTFLVDL
jgi:hypothetical protein